MSESSETIAALATAPGRGGVAVVRVSGPSAHAIAAALTGRPVDASYAGRFFFSSFHAPRGTVPAEILDSGLVLVFAAPRSYTGEDVVEFQGHGGSVAPRRVLEACLAAGARLARRGEFTQRAFLNGRLDLGAAEAVIDLVDAKTDRAATDAVARLGGATTRPIETLYRAALDLSSQVEHALDFSEDELPPDFASGVTARVQDLRTRIERQLSTAREGKLLREGALVVLAGAPNAGKSSLLNALLGENRAIVSQTAGTTRDAIEAWFEVDGWPIRLMDTAGLRTTEDAIEAEGVDRAEALIARADVVLALDCDIPGALRVHAKCDLDVAPGARTDQCCVSSRTGEGLEALKRALAARLATLAAKAGEETGADVTTRQKELLIPAAAALERAWQALTLPEWVLAANELRTAAECLGKILGKVYSEDLLDALFSRFCVGK